MKPLQFDMHTNLTAGLPMRDRPSVVQLVGGLGSQLGGYFFGQYLIHFLGHDVIFDLSELDRGYSKHGVSITTTSLEGEFKNFRTMEIPAVYNMRRLSYAIGSRLGPLGVYLPWGSYTAKEVGWSPNHTLPPKGTVFRGEFFTSWYFKELTEIGLSYSLSKKNPSRYFKHFKSSLSGKPFLSIHLRRGDYVELADRFGLVPFTYYSDAIRLLTRMGARWSKAVIFSDDLDQAALLGAHLETLAETVLYETPEGSDPAEEMDLMTDASYHIMANSSFSLWGALLSRQSKIRVAPSPWAKSFETPRRLLPQDVVTVKATLL